MQIRRRVSRKAPWWSLGLIVLGGLAARAPAQGTLPPVPFPPENPLTESKRVLGKILFWDEQLSSDNTIACGTCHQPRAGGADPRLAVHPGPDGILGTPDDLRTSPGVISADGADEYLPAPIFGLQRQLTSRAANPAILSMYAPELFWDGRAPSRFTDPETGATVIAAGGALESQAIAPVLSDVEMAHTDRDWAQVALKLRRSVPMGLAGELPPDIAAALSGRPDYPALFEAAFGDDAITPARIGLAIATYERTLVPDQTPFDRFLAGIPGAMTPQQQQGFNVFQGSDCRICHTPPLFTNNAFHNIGLRPNTQDIGREGVTGLPADRGRFKTPTLRNVGLKPTLMHTGQFTTLGQVFPFYAGPGAPGNPNRDPILPSPIPPQAQPAVIDFLANALTDPRVANEQFPFDRPRLRAEMPANPRLLGPGAPGSGGLTPVMIAVCPPNIGNQAFKIGLDRALAGALAEVAIARQPPVGGVLTPELTSDPIPVEGLGVGNGFATFRWPVPDSSAYDGAIFYMQWRVQDPFAPGGVALSPVAELTLFCGAWCDTPCPADLAEPAGVLDLADVLAFSGAFLAGGARADLAPPFGVMDLLDVQAFTASFIAGCP